MPHMHNSEYAAKVGQDKPIKDVLEVYDAHYGKYACNVCHDSHKSMPVDGHHGFALKGAKEGK